MCAGQTFLRAGIYLCLKRQIIPRVTLGKDLKILIKCDRLHENPPYGINAQFAQCAFLVLKVETYQISFFVIFMS